MSVASLGSTNSNCLVPGCYSAEDYIAPVLDTTTEILTDPSTDFDSVTIVYCDCEDSNCVGKSGKAKSCHKPITKRRSSSRSFICNSLLSALDTKHTDELTYEEEMKTSDTVELEEGQTINFYSFADVINGEHDLERFNSTKMSEIISQTQ